MSFTALRRRAATPIILIVPIAKTPSPLPNVPTTKLCVCNLSEDADPKGGIFSAIAFAEY